MKFDNPETEQLVADIRECLFSVEDFPTRMMLLTSALMCEVEDSGEDISEDRFMDNLRHSLRLFRVQQAMDNQVTVSE